MTTITAIQALEALDELESSARGDGPFNNFAALVVRGFIENALAEPATAPAHTEEEVQHLLEYTDKGTRRFMEPAVRRILGVPAP